ncbi:hypothetical protein ILYODFUR_008162 [Ilyodon furcidens]|uniref:Uncharacterized protein n=1 Tax=Ilyodon furcidens TaxID=33524 RepID=A0ABV0T6A8_9TELE
MVPTQTSLFLIRILCDRPHKIVDEKLKSKQKSVLTFSAPLSQNFIEPPLAAGPAADLSGFDSISFKHLQTDGFSIHLCKTSQVQSDGWRTSMNISFQGYNWTLTRPFYLSLTPLDVKLYSEPSELLSQPLQSMN